MACRFARSSTRLRKSRNVSSHWWTGTLPPTGTLGSTSRRHSGHWMTLPRRRYSIVRDDEHSGHSTSRFTCIHETAIAIQSRSIILPFAHRCACCRGHARTSFRWTRRRTATTPRLLSGTVTSRVVRVGVDPVPEIVIEARVEGGEPCLDHGHLAPQILILTTPVSYP